MRKRWKMDRRNFLKRSLGGAALAALAAKGAGASSAKPNVLFIQPDQHRGAIMGCAGDTRIRTPNLDKLAKEGIRFTRCASSSPVCSPCRGTFQTGLYPYMHGVVKNNLLLDPPDTEYIGDIFSEAGYATGYIGKWHLDGFTPKVSVGGYIRPGWRRRGYQEWHGYQKSHEYFNVWQFDESQEPPVKVRVKGYDWEPAWQTDVMLEFAQRHGGAGKPWMFYLGYGPPHLPEQCHDALKNHYSAADLSLPPDVEGRFAPEVEAKLRRTIQTYYGQVEALDVEVGRVLAGLKALGQDENTIIAYTSDHGDHLGSHASSKKVRGKSTPYATAFRVPLIIRWPKGISPRVACEALVSTVDIPPTMLELAGLPVPWKMQGDSMAGWCTEGKGPENPGIFIALADWQAVWDGRYIYCPHAPYNILYDHENDPYEMKNLIERPEAEGEKKRLGALLKKLARRAARLPERGAKV